MTATPHANTVKQQLPEDEQRRRFEQTCLPLRNELWRFSLWLARDSALADDIVQETLLRAWRHIASLNSDATARAWLFTIARRELARARANRGVAFTNVDELNAADEALLATASPADDLQDLRRALWRLPDAYREPLLLQVDVGLSVKEIAKELGLSQAAVLTRLFRAREQLRTLLGYSQSKPTNTDLQDDMSPTRCRELNEEST